MNVLTILLIIIICVSLISNLTMTGGGSNSGCKGHIKSSVRYENIPSETLINDNSSST